jgi:hypothetical protein
MAKPAIRLVMNSSPPAGWFGHLTMLITLLVVGCASALLWLVPIEVFEQWAFDRAGTGTFERFEAVGETDFLVWLWRIVGLMLLIVVWRVWLNLSRWQIFALDLWRGMKAVTRFPAKPNLPNADSLIDRIRTLGCRGLLVGWFIVFVAHFVHGIGLRAHDWPYFKFNSGEVVLPNISNSNRAVIRYLQQATSPNARILVVSDQKLFFLSYYLRPRTLLHRMHPESEHVIPLKDQERKLAAYRLDELSSEDLAQMPYDYTLEYFEHPDLVDRSQVLSDAAWIDFVRQREGNRSLIPSYQVRLRKGGER